MLRLTTRRRLGLRSSSERGRAANLGSDGPSGAGAIAHAVPIRGAVNARRVLVVEDDAVARSVAARILERRGLAVDVAADGREALEMHAQNDYDLIFMDCHMPEIDGYEATREIRRREGSCRHTPIVALTVSSEPGDRDRCLSAGMDFYATKPIHASGLEYVISQALGLGAGTPSPR